MSAYQAIPKFLHVSFLWNTSPKTKELELVFNQALEWMKYAPNCWVLWTTTDAQGWYDRIAPHITQGDRVFICELNLQNKQGWMERWAWEWLNKPRITFAQPAGR